MTERKNIYYATPGLLAVIIFASDFLSTEIFKSGYQDFSVWFLLSLFAFVCGWLINKTLGYNHGGKVIFAVIISVSFISVVMITMFREYFGLNDLLVENMILYLLRNVMLGSMALFGMVTCELLILQRDKVNASKSRDEIRNLLESAKREANIIIDEAKIGADKIIYEAQKTADEIINRKNQLEMQLKELIAAEKELIKKYESEE
ncbi:hypothetical protein MROS_2111 [Melioribacter roseus P3M-2]|jgi:hypothetical protein|uniref:Uncharacterized protein n=1 Tax=Melioribacter roseus (strain DSM 23840 / JCM 17771 / VKM B-2668 / P3M-2) TaxID=1191523 RepID=I7A626_MELRP|nr:hypothetical protein [Melioribacter roseus]AFN75341.1 hypothetical protein MROS_2111 [Melioribacter roseus P3M-2]